MSGILYNQVMCDYQVFHTSDDTGFTTDPVYNHHNDDYHQDNAKSKEFDLSGYKRISPIPKFTQSHLYISPENAEPHFTRSVPESKGGYGDGYSAFIQKHFQDDGDDDVNSNYRQKSDDDDEDVEVNSNYRQRNDASDDDDEVNSNYRQNDDDDDDDDNEEVKSNYQYAPKIEVEENNRHYYGVGFDRIQSLPQTESKQHVNVKNCKIIAKGKAMCKLCKDPVSGAHSESCSFSSAPPEHKYAFIKKEKYIS